VAATWTADQLAHLESQAVRRPTNISTIGFSTQSTNCQVTEPFQSPQAPATRIGNLLLHHVSQ